MAPLTFAQLIERMNSPTDKNQRRETDTCNESNEIPSTSKSTRKRTANCQAWRLVNPSKENEIPSTSKSTRKRTANCQAWRLVNPSEEKRSPVEDPSKRRKMISSSSDEEDNDTMKNHIQNFTFTQLVLKYSEARSKLDQACEELSKINYLVADFMTENDRIVGDIGKFNGILTDLINNDQSKMNTIDNFDELVRDQKQNLCSAVEIIKKYME